MDEKAWMKNVDSLRHGENSKTSILSGSKTLFYPLCLARCFQTVRYSFGARVFIPSFCILYVTPYLGGYSTEVQQHLENQT